MVLSELKVNQYAILLSIFYPNQKVKRRLLEMGMVPGTVVKVTKMAPLKDPIAISLRGYELCVNRREASYISVEVKK